jgi:exoribonuclease-2
MLPWSSIDNGDSRDLDQIEVAEQLENDVIRVRIGIADVDSRVARVGAIDAHAAQNATTVYTGVAVFPMLPLALSTDLTSLSPAADRAAVVAQLDIAADGSVTASTLYRALVRNHAQLAYESVGAWLAGAAPLPAEAGQVDGLAAQLKLQDEAAQRLLAARRRAGSLDFETVEARAVVRDGRVVDLAVTHKDRARGLIENFMVAANGAVAGYLADAGRLGLGRIVRRPARWPRIVALAAALGEELPQEPDARRLSAFLERRKAADPLHYPDLSLSIVKLLGPGEYEVMRPGAPSAGHFGLAVSRYAHSTAPNRRYADLISQRLVKAALAGATAPYNDEALARLAAHCTEREGAAQKVERTMRKVAAALLFGHRIGQSFDAVVTGSSQKGTWVRTLHPPVEGRLMADRHHGARVDAADVGDRVRVKLLHTDPDRGWIDFGLEE